MATSAEAVDAVYTWVDGSSPHFARDLARAHPGGEGSGVDARRRRFRDNGELRYSLRSLLRFAPWVRHIYLVTNGERPPWLDRRGDRVRVVAHAALFDRSDDLPTFNSNAIELHLHRIPGLSRKFLYLNDDLFLGRPCARADFEVGGADAFFFERQSCPTDAEVGEVHDRAYAFTMRRVGEAVGCPPLARLPAHTPQLYDRDAIDALAARFDAEFRATAGHRLRSPTDFVLRIAYAATGLGDGRLRERVLAWGSSEYTFLSLDDRALVLLRHLLGLRARRPRFYCLNDDLGDVAPSHPSLRLTRWFLRASHPRPTPLEIGRRERPHR